MARTMTIDLGDELREFVESLVESGDYRTQSEVVRDSLRLLREKQAESKLENLKKLIQQGLDSGVAEDWNIDDFLKRMRARVGIDEKDDQDNEGSR
ncbi:MULTISPECIES: type II toxin-antitoxin system ParD family antitoxin [unclassified Pantoea]|uniref:type II toxin-antitoxin system ParD family antitoxin n=1 Tax=unclassified Pantoea TaxID=2630326 RepID=UPI0012AD99C5|nr:MULTISPECIES: type II toxin-antitoxin system ParD family antitoxin [unclassified Pantoea]MEA5101774.1 type II toxin-antitoxin system ParD family antitoxin [Pantoea sp. S18]MRT43128.1 type II toxin-antitoxin system ParD family antitoxin [Enterobacteriaceae bacterium RIT702]UVC31402.1 type II toxin-antitoxin system ParD family antitoxin [Pantoea sp. SOD02]